MKKIVYRNGLLTFKLPMLWIEKHGDDGGAVFFSSTAMSGRLNLNVLTFKTTHEANTEMALKICSQKKEFMGFQVTTLPNGNAISQYIEVDESRNIASYHWEIANPLSSKHIRLAIFSYQVYKTCLEMKSVQAEIALLNKEIRSAKFAYNVDSSI
jgi:hypothetical protein